ncbi:MAG: MCE family protein [Azonexus sp.]|jgi:phospholipid/cholesterol/gamma-HCH transport system substrate-binding protein|nr:MCE family protein [Betaproteobacteria bacterium]MBK8918153.1 MCE family protein [Betaproteobacteria bacterium]MBP6035370.1 MCE family protein [Azonexus sp.]MBP6906055.1 MCE family protein [Azonexus sp.]
MENKSHAFLAGIFVIFFGLAGIGALFWFGGKKELTRDYVVVTRQNVTGLNPQGQVRYRGIQVGKVKAINLDPEDVRNILISISISREVPVTRGTIAKLGYQGITGLAHVLLEETGKDTTPLDDEDPPPRIAMKPSLLDELGDSGAETLRQARHFLESASALLNEGNRARIASLLANAEGLSGQMKPTLDNLNGTLVQVRALLSDENLKKLSATADQAAPLLAETRELVKHLAVTSEKLDSAIGDPAGNGAAGVVPRLHELSADVSATSRQLSRVLRLIEDSPQALVFGAPPQPPGPGEPGFTPPAGRQP